MSAMHEIAIQPGQSVLIKAVPSRQDTFTELSPAQQLRINSLRDLRIITRTFAQQITYLQGGNPDDEVSFFSEAGEQLVPLVKNLRKAKIMPEEVIENISKALSGPNHNNMTREQADDYATNFFGKLASFAKTVPREK